MKHTNWKKMAAWVIVAITFAASNSLAGDKERRVVFPKGKNTVVYKGNLPRQIAERDSYIITLKKGQRLTVKLSTADASASFKIFELDKLGPDEDMIFNGSATEREFSGSVPVASRYSIQVYGPNEDGDAATGAPYSIEITRN
ncbi:MAG: hypothetical protein DYH05_13200 [Acidobacteria bacterium ACB1]|nr:hypothetical protein [Acidobacteria bacterium ACB1]RIJ94191.1 MAG: hypothetical protein DCC44_04980 [Acidobacteriota bacterium]